MSIHEIDTTPREPSAETRPAYTPPKSPSSAGQGQSKPAAGSTPERHSYEVIEQASDKPKGGWWKRFTGQ
jgi:hypothetical protein